MTTVKNNKKPFGLTLSVKIALEAMRENIAPSSVIFGNLFFLQKSTSFPQDLDKYFFANPKAPSNEVEKKAITKLLDSVKRPQIDVQKLLEEALENGWAKKIPPKAPVRLVAKKVAPKKSTKITTAKTVTAPTIIVKKNRLV